MKRLLLCLLVGCTHPTAIWPDAPGPFTIPLLETWHIDLPMVEVLIDGRGPLVFVVDTAASGMSMTSGLAEQLGLSLHGSPLRGPQTVRLKTVQIGDLLLRDVPMTVLFDSRLLLWQDRRVVGILGDGLFESGVLDLDPGAGRVRIFRSSPAPIAGATRVPLVRSRPPSVSVDFPGGRVGTVVLRTGRNPLQLRRGSAKAVDLKPLGIQKEDEAPKAWFGGGRIGRFKFPDSVVLPLASRDGIDGILGFNALKTVALRIDRLSEHASLRPRAHQVDILRRFPDAPDCGPGFHRCAHGVARPNHDGQMEWIFEKPTVRLSDRYWVRVAVGPYSALIQLQPEPNLPLIASLPVTIPMSGAPIPLTVVDIVPVMAPCRGHVCLRGFAERVERNR